MSPHLFFVSPLNSKKSPTPAQKPKCPSYERPAKKEFFSFFLSAAHPTDQGEESVLLLLVVVGGDHFSSSHVLFFGV